ESDDPRQPVRRALLVQQVEALEAENAFAASGESIERCAAQPPAPDADAAVPLHGPDPIRAWLNGRVSTAVETVGENRVRLTVDVSPDQGRHAVDPAMS